MPVRDPAASLGHVIILTAGVGAGHDRAADAWAAQLTAAGHTVEVRDLLGVLRRHGRPGLSRMYESVLHKAPWVYELLFRSADSPLGILVARSLLGLFLKRTAALITSDSGPRLPGHRAGAVSSADHRPAGVLCTYPVAGHLLGELRRSGRLDVPVVVYLTDFSVHRLCISPGIDAYFAVHPVSREQALRHGTDAVTVTGPLVDSAFHTQQVGGPEDQRAARLACGLPEDDRLALLVAGSWGVGSIECAARDIIDAKIATPVIVCGHNERLRSQLIDRGLGIVLGWVDNMPTIMRAVDVLVENAGGLTSLEAMAVGLPVATYRPIAGHGRTNAQALEQAGVATYIRAPEALSATLSALIDPAEGGLQRSRAAHIFSPEAPVNAFKAVLENAHRLPDQPSRSTTGPSRWAPTAVRVGSWGGHLVAATMLIILVLLGNTIGAGFAVAHGLQGVHVPDRQPDSYLIVRPTSSTRLTPRTIALIRQTSAGVAVDLRYAERQPTTVRALARAGVPIVNAVADTRDGDAGLHRPAAIRDGMHAITRLTGARPTLYLANGRVDALDLAAVSLLHERVIQPRGRADDAVPTRVRGGELIVIDCSRRPACDLDGSLSGLQHSVGGAAVRLAPVTDLVR